MSCGSITMGSTPDCDNLPLGGTRARVGVWNYDDVLSITEDQNGRVTGVTLAPGATGYVFTGFRNDVQKSEEVVNPGIGINQFRHLCRWVVYSREQEQKNNVERLSKGRFIVVVENRGKDDDAFEVLGLGVGVEIVAGAIRNAYENGGFFVLNFATPEGEFESKLPQSLGTDYSDAVSLFESYFPEGSGS